MVTFNRHLIDYYSDISIYSTAFKAPYGVPFWLRLRCWCGHWLLGRSSISHPLKVSDPFLGSLGLQGRNWTIILNILNASRPSLKATSLKLQPTKSQVLIPELKITFAHWLETLGCLRSKWSCCKSNSEFFLGRWKVAKLVNLNSSLMSITSWRSNTSHPTHVLRPTHNAQNGNKVWFFRYLDRNICDVKTIC